MAPQIPADRNKDMDKWSCQSSILFCTERLNSLVFTKRSGVKIQCSDLLYMFYFSAQRTFSQLNDFTGETVIFLKPAFLLN